MPGVSLTLPQWDIYFEQTAFPNAPIYNIGAKIIIRGDVDPLLLEKAYKTMVDHHETFHTIIKVANGIPSAHVLDRYGYRWSYLDLSGEKDALASAEQFCTRDFMIPFDLSSGAILNSFCLIRISVDCFYLYSKYHHLTTDGWGASLLFQRLTEYYNDLKQYGEIRHRYDFKYQQLAENEAGYRSAGMDQDTAYWKEKFAGLPPMPLSPGRGEAKKNLPASARTELYIKRELYDRINVFSKEQQVSTFHFWLGILFTWFARSYNLSEFSVGIPILNRSTADFKRTVGTFMMITPFRLPVDIEKDFIGLLKNIRNELRQDYKHQRLPLRNIKEAAGLHATSGNELYQVFFSYEKHNYASTFLDCQTSVIPLSHGMERVPLAVYVREFNEEEDVKIDFDYNLAFFTPRAARRLVGHLTRLMEAVLDAPALPLADLVYLSEEETSLLLSSLPAPSREFPVTDTLPAIIRRHASLFKEKTALKFNDSYHSYEQLAAATSHIADALSLLGIGRSGLVALMVDRSDQMLLLMLGILESGAAHLTIDPAFPEARINYILRDSGANLLITEKKYAGLVPEGMNVIFREEWPAIDNLLPKPIETDNPEDKRPNGDDTAYMLYTSGSTGLPKGVKISHRSLMNLLLSMQEAPGIGPSDNMLALTTYSFDIALLELYGPLVAGASVTIADAQSQKDPQLLQQLIRKGSPTIMQATPGSWSLLLGSGWKGDAGLCILCGGEKLQASLTAALLPRCRSLWNMYGPTETTIWSSLKKIEKTEDCHSIGRPIANTSIFILDDRLQPVPPGIEGEICIGGMGLAIGYHHNPDLTARRFVHPPFAANDDLRLYRTGDIGEWSEEGEILISGRRDEQVKIRGYRIELTEIENVIAQHEHVASVAVAVKEFDGYDKSLIAYLVWKTLAPISTLAKHAAALLPQYMIPEYWIVLDALPFTPNGKIDRNRLKNWDITDKQPPLPDSPLSHEEKILLTIWREVLQKDDISPADNFFQQGGNSMKILKLITAIQERLSVQISFAEVFEHAAFRQMAALLPAGINHGLPGFEQTAITAPYLPTSFQRHIWTLSQQAAGSLAYTLSYAYRITGSLGIDRQKEAASQLMQQYEILRTVFRNIDGKIVQEVLTPAAYPSILEVYRDKTEEEAIQTITLLNKRPFHLEKGPLWKIVIFILPSEEQLLFFRLHHIIGDGFSMGILTRAFFSNCRTSEYPPLQPDPLPFQFKEYAAWYNGLMDTPFYNKAYAYWKEVFSTPPVPVRWQEFPMPPRHSYKGKTIHFPVPPACRRMIAQLAGQYNVSDFIVLLTTYCRLLYGESGTTDLVICVPVSGRDAEEFRDQPGLFTNTIALRIQIDPADNFEALCSRVKQAFLDGYRYQVMPFDQLATLIEKLHDRDPAAIFTVMLNYQSAQFAPDRLAFDDGTSITRVNADPETTKFHLSFNVYDNGEGYHLDIEYRDDIFPEDYIVKLYNDFIGLPALIAADPGSVCEQRTADAAPGNKLMPADIDFDFE